jgi:Raf kinase inhibitor-like YbhB/YbcL family protein
MQHGLWMGLIAAAAMIAPVTVAAKDTTNGITLESKDFKANDALPKSASCDGDGKSPELHWTAPKSADAKSFALIVDDPDAPKGTYTHWVLFDIPSSVTNLPAGQSTVGVSGTNSSDKTGYAGACPPKGDKPHHYHFKLYALDVDKLGQKQGAARADVEGAMKTHVKEQTELVGTFERR